MDPRNSRLGDSMPLDNLQTASVVVCLTTDQRIIRNESARGAVVIYGSEPKQIWVSQLQHPFANPKTRFVRMQ
ncbi:hypothetical protein ACU4GI_47080 (plasmid) [Cupriavidus basilensis]